MKRGTMRVNARFYGKSAALALAIGAAACAVPASANSASVDYFRNRIQNTAVPSLLSNDDKSYYGALFAAIGKEDWATVQAMFAQRPDGPLHAVALSEYYLAANSPKAELTALTDLLDKARDLPWADQIGRLATKRGATDVPAFSDPQRLVALPSAPKRLRPRSIADGTMPDSVGLAIQDRIKNDDPMGARQLLDGIDASLSPEARAEWRQKVSWAFYIENDDLAALSLARTVPEGAGPWVPEGWWTVGLAAWRLGDCAEAADAFQKSAVGAQNDELAAAGYYWASRAWLRCRAPEKVAANLKAAALRGETLYGLLASEALDLRPPVSRPAPDFSSDDWKRLREIGNVRRAVELSEIGQDDLAGEILRYQARVGSADQYAPLSRLARDLGLASTQLWMAYNAPRGGRPDDASRYPSPRWTPASGWKVDPALIYAHALQESNFRTTAVSPAAAKGLMQITPITVRQHAGSLALTAAAVDLTNPEINLAFGQRNLEMLRDSAGTQGLLPKVMAAYNAGLAPVSRWNSEIRDNGDPLLWMESIPYWETRGYVSVVMRNYWMYEKQAGGHSDSRAGLAQGLWPKFPGLSGAQSVRIASRGD
ncbi:lytic transglycosylase domain-containing protein [Novosphingobium tardum]|uniref:Lytic transglycosylase domain-containing protein n=1 Tax=Novosphingobium tardum TaxID=1538021 RepID=A0ABV8RPV6_9SPHN